MRREAHDAMNCGSIPMIILSIVCCTEDFDSILSLGIAHMVELFTGRLADYDVRVDSYTVTISGIIVCSLLYGVISPSGCFWWGELGR